MGLPGETGRRDKAIETLATRLYWCLENFDPPGWWDENLDWDHLPEYDRSLYRRIIEDLISTRNLSEIRLIVGDDVGIDSTGGDRIHGR